jgi:Domain of unknown function (DUF4349)
MVLRGHRVRGLRAAVVVLAALGTMSGCGRTDHVPVAATTPAPAMRGPAGAAMQAEGVPKDAQDAQPGAPTEARHIAYTHRYTIEAERARLRAVLDAHLARCKQLNCEVVTQSYEEENDHQPPRANLTVRVAHKDTPAFGAALNSPDGRVVRQSTAAEDKTLQVVDIEARITNLQQLRERLRKLLADPKAGIKEAVEIERQLAQTQSELDSFAAQRRVLAQQTERELFDIGYQARRSPIERSIFAPVKDALLNFGGVFMHSVGVLIQFVAASMVWIALLAILWMLFRRWRRRKKVVYHSRDAVHAAAQCRVKPKSTFTSTSRSMHVKLRYLLGIAVTGFALAAPAAAQSKDPFAVLDAIGPEMLFKGVIREDDVSLLFRHIREQMAASARGEEAKPSEAMNRRSEEIQREIAVRGTVLMGVLLSAFEQAARQAVREGLGDIMARPAPRQPAPAPATAD